MSIFFQFSTPHHSEARSGFNYHAHRRLINQPPFLIKVYGRVASFLSFQIVHEKCTLDFYEKCLMAIAINAFLTFQNFPGEEAWAHLMTFRLNALPVIIYDGLPPPPPSPGQYKTSSTATHVHGSIKHPFPVISFLFKNWFATRCEYLHLINNNSQCFFTRSEFFLIRCKYRICDDWKRGISRILQISSTIYKAQEKD